MAILGTFSSFTTARLGIYASQASLQVTGNNIANINTDGYTRQRTDLWSLNSTGTSKYANPNGVDIGYGVLVKSTSQLRDPYLDIRYRNENTKLGAAQATLAGLQKISQTLDEVNKGTDDNGVIENALKDFKSRLQGLAKQVGSEEQDGLVREAAKSITTFFNTASKQLQDDWDLQKDELEDTIKDVNECLVKIRDLNEQIRKQGIYGDNALELRDHRNLEIDKLSQYLGINVEYSMERIDQYTEVEKLTITLKDTKDPRSGTPSQPIKLVDGLYATQLSLSEVEANPTYASGQPQTAKLNPDYKPQAAEGQPGYGKYLDEKGNGTNDITKANMLLMNPDFTKHEVLRNPGYDQDGFLYLDDEGKGTNDVSQAARVMVNPEYYKSVPLRNPDYDPKQPKGDKNAEFLDENNQPTNDESKAKHVRANPDYDEKETDKTKPTSWPYLDKDGNPVNVTNIKDADQPAQVGKYLIKSTDPKKPDDSTDDITKATKVPRYLGKDGKPVEKAKDAANATRKYLTDPQYVKDVGTDTNDITKAAKVDPNKFLFQLERLEDKFGEPMDRDKPTESVVVPLNDTELTGALQSMRELLTEEGEFASKNDVGIAYDDDYKDLLKALGYEDDEIKNLSAAGREQARMLLERSADENANIKFGIPYYQKRLDLLAQKFAEVFNEANQLPVSTVYESEVPAPANADSTKFVKKAADGTLKDSIMYTDSQNVSSPITWGDVTIEVDALDSEGNVVKDENGDPVKERIPLDSPRAREALREKLVADNATATPKPTDTQIDQMVDDKLAKAVDCLEILRGEGVLKKEYAFYDGGVLFSNNGNTNDPSGINAGNITISNSWAARTVRVLNKKEPDTGDMEHSSDNDNINHMISMFEKQLDYSASELEPDANKGNQIFFHGSFQEMYTNLGATLGSQTNMMDSVAYNYEVMTLDIDNSRLSVSGVDLNDEATNMMQFQKSYQAACRLLTTIDSMLDTLINGTLR